MTGAKQLEARLVAPGAAEGPALVSPEALSFWGGVDPATSRVIDAHHPLRGVSLAGVVLLMPTSRGSCSGSGVLLDMALNRRAPAALVFRGPEDTLTLGALIAAELYGAALPVLRVSPQLYESLARATSARIEPGRLVFDDTEIELISAPETALELTQADREALAGGRGAAARIAMRIVTAMAAQQGARRLVDVARAHIDGCIYASPANLKFAEDMAALGARVSVPTTTNAISVDRDNWRAQGVAPAFGGPAAALADAYVAMGCAPSFTCAPYLLDDPPRAGEVIAWSESNAVLFANSVLGARTAKHPDFLDLCIALVGRAPLSGPYLDEERKARRIIEVEAPPDADESFWPMVGYLAGKLAPDRIPLLRGLAAARPSRDDLKALCAAFGATSAAPMLHIEGVTPEAADALGPADICRIERADLRALWGQFNRGPSAIDLVAFGSPHASLEECRAIANEFNGRRRRDDVDVVLTAGRAVIAEARRSGLVDRLEASGVRILPDLCWCSITEPLFPPRARCVLTNSGKYAHYGEGLSGRTVRFAGIADCVAAALSGKAPAQAPGWLR